MKLSRNEEPEIIQFSLRIPIELNETLKKIAIKTGVGKNSIIVNALWEFAESKK